MGVFAERDILDLSVSERIQLAQDIWDSVAEVPESLALGACRNIPLSKAP